MSSCDHDGAPISDRTLDALRTTAAILASVPHVSARVRTTRGVVVEVRWPPFPELGHSAMAVCTFRRAVAKAEADCKVLQQEVDAKKKELTDTKAWNEYVKTVNARTPKRCQLKNVGAIW